MPSAQVTFADKQSRQKLFATEINSIKQAINTNALSLDEVITALGLSPNNRKSLLKSVLYFDETVAGYTAGDSTLSGIDGQNCALGGVTNVEFGPAGYRQFYILVYDAAPGSGPGLFAFQDGRFTGNRLPAKWVWLNSAAAGVRAYVQDPVGYEYAVEDIRRAYVNDATEEQFFAALLSGPLPAPTTKAGDANWRHISATEVPSSGGQYTAFQRILQASAIDLLNDDVVTAARLYAVTIGGQEVWVHGLDGGLFAGLGYIIDPEYPHRGKPMAVNIETGSITPFGGVAHKTGATLTFADDAEYNEITYGTFTVDTSTKVIGRVVTAYLGPAANQPILSNTEFQSKDIWIAGKHLMYMFKVGANGMIQYNITQLD